jgi:hypothetical protein
MIAFWTILHGLVAIALVGAITHQGLSVWRTPAPARRFFDRFRAVRAAGYTSAVVPLYVVVFTMGALIYPIFVLDVKGTVADYGMRMTMGVFQLKEHLGVVGLAMLPSYWHFWRSVPLNEAIATRRFLTTLLMVCVWWNLVVGHLLNNLKGMT